MGLRQHLQGGVLQEGGRFSLPKPLTAAEVIEVCLRLRDQPGFLDWRNVTETRYRLRHRHLAVDVKGISQLLEDRSPAINEHIKRYVNRLDAAGIRIQVSARSPDEAAVAAAQNWERFLYALYFDLTRRRTNRVYAADRRAIDQMAAYGCGISKLDFEDDVRRRIHLGETINSFDHNPFVLENPDLSAMAWEQDLSVMAEFGEKTVSTLHLLYNGDDDVDVRRFLTSDTMETGSSRSLDWDKLVGTYHLETPDYIYDALGPAISGNAYGGLLPEGHLLEMRPNAAGRPWYSLMPGDITSERSPLLEFQPLVAGVYPLVQMLNVLDTLLMSGALQTGRPMWQEVSKGAGASHFADIMMPAESGELPTVRFDPTEETLPPPRPGHEWIVVPVPDQQHLLGLRDMKKRELQEYGFPAPLDPSQPLVSKSGYDTREKREPAAEQLKPALFNRASAWYEHFQRVAEIIQKGEFTITMHVHPEGRGHGPKEVITVGPKDVKEHDLVVQFESIPDATRQITRESNIRMLQEGLMSRQTFMAVEYDDPVAEEERIFSDELTQFTKQQAVAVLQRMFLEQSQELQAQVAAEQQIALATQLAPQEGGPAPGQENRVVRPEEPGPALGAPPLPPPPSQDRLKPPPPGRTIAAVQ